MLEDEEGKQGMEWGHGGGNHPSLLVLILFCNTHRAGGPFLKCCLLRLRI